jgi:hypothetical protein
LAIENHTRITAIELQSEWHNKQGSSSLSERRQALEKKSTRCFIADVLILHGVFARLCICSEQDIVHFQTVAPTTIDVTLLHEVYAGLSRGGFGSKRS